MKVKRPLSGYYALDVCDRCQAVLDVSPYLPRNCHSCGRELCKHCAEWQYYSDGGDGEDRRTVAYCAECDARLTNQDSEGREEVVLHGLYQEMARLQKQREDAMDRWDEAARKLQSAIHESASRLDKSLGKFSL